MKTRMIAKIARLALIGSFGAIGVVGVLFFPLWGPLSSKDMQPLAAAAGSHGISTEAPVSQRISSPPPSSSAAQPVSSPQPKAPALQQPLLSQRTNVPFVAVKAVLATNVTPVYDDSLSQGWEDASWDSAADLNQTQAVYAGASAILWTPSSRGDWGAFSLRRAYKSGQFDVSPFTNFRFHVRGASAAEKAKKFGVSLNGSDGPRVDVTPYIQGGSISPDEWRLVDIPLAALGVDGGEISRITIQDISGVVQPPSYFDDVEFYQLGEGSGPSGLPESITVNVDANADQHEINPLIYGLGNSEGAEAYFDDMGVSVVRWGGNARTRHNWEINASNAGSDWEFRNLNQAGGSTKAGQASFNFVKKNQAVGAESFLTIPTIGWVARDGSNNTRSTSVPKEGGSPVTPGSEAIPGYDPTANRGKTSVRSYAKKGTPFSYPPSSSDGSVFQDEWVNYLVSTLGDAQNGGVRFYAMDNEADLWADDTHVDVHPVRVGYDEALNRFLEYAEAVKAVDRSAKLTGPVGWGWTSLWYSALDRGNDNFKTHADRTAHGDVPFVPWFLQQLKEHDDAVGHRTLDILDMHYYPQGNIYSKEIDSVTQAKRLRSTRSLWDPTYADESWIARSEEGPAVQMIPRLKELIAAYYPGTELGLTEWSWGADGHISGALAIADVLGIFGREGVYLANYWTKPANNSPGYWAWRMYRNYDGAHSGFGDVSVRAETSDVDKVSAFAGKDSASGELKIIFVNKMPATEANVTLNVGNFDLGTRAKAYEFAKKNVKGIAQLPDVALESNQVQMTLSPYSITLVVIGSE